MAMPVARSISISIVLAREDGGAVIAPTIATAMTKEGLFLCQSLYHPTGTGLYSLNLIQHG